MKTTLAVHLFSSPQSRTRKLYFDFLDEATRQEPGFRVTDVDLWTEPIRALGPEDHSRRVNLMTGEAKLLLGHDRYIFAFPIWNFSAPAQLKGFIDRAVMPGSVFDFGPTGINSPLRGRKAIILSTAGGVYPNPMPPPFDSLKRILEFLGVQVQVVFVEGCDLKPFKEVYESQNILWQQLVLNWRA